MVQIRVTNKKSISGNMEGYRRLQIPRISFYIERTFVNKKTFDDRRPYVIVFFHFMNSFVPSPFPQRL